MRPDTLIFGANYTPGLTGFPHFRSPLLRGYYNSGNDTHRPPPLRMINLMTTNPLIVIELHLQGLLLTVISIPFYVTSARQNIQVTQKIGDFPLGAM